MLFFYTHLTPLTPLTPPQAPLTPLTPPQAPLTPLTPQLAKVELSNDIMFAPEVGSGKTATIVPRVRARHTRVSDILVAPECGLVAPKCGLVAPECGLVLASRW